jgi:hypothetical protein
MQKRKPTSKTPGSSSKKTELDPLTLNIQTIRNTVHNTGQLVNSQCSDNHSSLYFLLQNSKAVQLNMRTEPDYVDGVYEMTPRDYQQSRSEIIHFDYPVLRPLTAQYIDSVLRYEGFHDYTFTDGGVGCRYWRYDQMSFWIAAPF